METLRFLMVTTHFPPYHLGGDAVLVEYLSQELLRRGHEVHVHFNPAAYRLLRKTEPSSETRKGDYWPVTHASSSRGLSPVMTLSFGYSGKASAELCNIVKRLNPDVVHWHNTKGFIAKLDSFPGKKCFYTAHDYYAICGRSNLIRYNSMICEKPRMCQICHLLSHKPPPLWRMDGRRVIRIPDDVTVISPSRFTAERLMEDGVGVDEILRNFVPDPGVPAPLHDDSEPEIVFLGMLEKHKGPMTLLRAFAKSRDRQRFSLRMIGDGGLRRELTTTASALRLEDRVKIPGFLSSKELADVRARAVGQIVPSEWYENAPLSLLEALAVGTPIIASNLGGLPEIADGVEGSKVFDAGNPDELAECLVWLWEQRDNLSRIRYSARHAYESRYHPEIHLRKYLDLIGQSA